MKWKPARQQHDLDRNVRHAAPWQLPEQRKRNAREYIGAGGAAALQNDSAAQIEVATMVERPAAVLCLVSAQVNGDLDLQRCVDLRQKMHHQNVFGGNRAVRLQLEQPIALRMLRGDERIARDRDAALQLRGVPNSGNTVRQDFRARLGLWGGARATCA